MIDSYSFGQMIVDGQEYSSDLIIYPDGRIQNSWWRSDGHRLTVEDISELLSTSPEFLVIGTGESGMMKVDDQIVKDNKSIHFNIVSTAEAVEIYNDFISQKKSVGACFHLTC